MGRLLNSKFQIILLFSILSGCISKPETVLPVTNFSLDSYLGVWHEIARIDNRFERGLTDVTATYTRRNDGGMEVLNRGYDSESNQWKEATGKAYFLDDQSIGHLKVSFFGPFYSSYLIFEYSEGGYAYVTGNSYEYLWLLSRTKVVSKTVIDQFISKANSLGFDTSKLIYNVGYLDQKSPLSEEELP
tara:strand:- start:1098 stop:1661 length:564 start_codon:yes stop_codon:yes gene_type:complete